MGARGERGGREGRGGRWEEGARREGVGGREKGMWRPRVERSDDVLAAFVVNELESDADLEQVGIKENQRFDLLASKMLQVIGCIHL